MAAFSALTVLDYMVLLNPKKRANQINPKLKFWKSKQLIVVWSYIKQ